MNGDCLMGKYDIIPPMNTRRCSFLATAFLGAGAAVSFVLAMHTFPGGYNPLMRMLSALGRTEVRLVEWPWSHYLFAAWLLCLSAKNAGRGR